jgi:hypothetical protein
MPAVLLLVFALLFIFVYKTFKQKYYSTYDDIFDLVHSEKLVVTLPKASDNSDPFAEPVQYDFENEQVKISYQKQVNNQGTCSESIEYSIKKPKMKNWVSLLLNFKTAPSLIDGQDSFTPVTKADTIMIFFAVKSWNIPEKQ